VWSRARRTGTSTNGEMSDSLALISAGGQTGAGEIAGSASTARRSDALALVSVGGQTGGDESKPSSATVSSANLHKQLLAQEVAKVRRRPARARFCLIADLSKAMRQRAVGVVGPCRRLRAWRRPCS
jgi:hypothetical protein